ncbi:MAG: MCE family protein [Planctomycetes bacterium]|nr:MCE family protein [Planctomycetota bacterium]
MARMPNFRYVSRKAGAFVLIAGILALVSLVVAGRAQGWFRVFPRLTINLPESGSYGLKDGSEVQILGIVIGQVTDVRVPPNGRMEALLKITKPDFIRLIRADSNVLIKKKFGIAGDPFVEFTKGTGEALDPETAVLQAEPDTEIVQLLQDFVATLQEKALPTLEQVPILLAELTRLARYFNDPDASFRQLLTRSDRIVGRLDELVSEIERGEGAIGQLLKDETIARRVNEMLARLDTSAQNIEAILADTRKAMANVPDVTASLRSELARLPEITGRLPKALDEMQGLLAELRVLSGDLTAISGAAREEVRDLPGLFLQVQELLRQTQRLVKGFQRHWLVRGYVPPDTSPGRIPPDAIGIDGGDR